MNFDWKLSLSEKMVMNIKVISEEITYPSSKDGAINGFLEEFYSIDDS